MSFSRDQIDKRFQVQLFLTQIITFGVFGYFYNDLFSITDQTKSTQELADGILRFVFFQSSHLMVVFGFSLLLSFIHRHRMTSVITCLWVACLAAQLYFVWNAIWKALLTPEYAKMGVYRAVSGEFASASVLIAACGIFGKGSNYQYFLLTVLFIPVYCLNEIIVLEKLHTLDLGGSVLIHVFSACFGLAVAYFVNFKKADHNNRNLASTQDSFTTTLLGTVFLWALWPSFNAAQASSPLNMNYAIINTYFALNAAVIGTVLVSVCICKGKFDLDQMANATLAGGVIIGTNADLIHSGFASAFLGFIGGVVSALLFQYSFSYLISKKLHDVAGIFNLHFIPGILGGVFSIASRAIWIDDKWFLQVYGLVFTILISTVFGAFSGMYIRHFHTGKHRNDFYNDFHFIKMKYDMESKLNLYESNTADYNGSSDAENEQLI